MEYSIRGDEVLHIGGGKLAYFFVAQVLTNTMATIT